MAIVSRRLEEHDGVVRTIWFLTHRGGRGECTAKDVPRHPDGPRGPSALSTHSTCGGAFRRVALIPSRHVSERTFFADRPGGSCDRRRRRPRRGDGYGVGASRG